MEYGSKVAGSLKPRYVEESQLSMSKPGEIYQIDIETDGVPDENAAITQLLKLEEQFPDLQVLWIKTNPEANVISMQFTDVGPGSFSFIGLMGAMPVLLGLAFIAVLALVFWDVFASNPLLLWALLVLGGATAFFYFTYGHLPMPSRSIYAGKTPDPSTMSAGERTTLLSHTLSAQSSNDEKLKLQKEMKDIQSKLADVEKEKSKDAKEIERLEKALATASEKKEKAEHKEKEAKNDIKTDIKRAEQEAKKKQKKAQATVRETS